MMTDTQAREAVFNVIRSLRYGEAGYFWMNDIQLRMLVYPASPDLEGKSLDEIKDASGKYLFKEVVLVAKNQGAGFVNYFWSKPGESQPIAKTSYVKLFEPWGIVIGLGTYNDEVQKIFSAKALKLGVVIVVSLLILGGLAIFMARGILIPLRKFESTLNEVQSGNNLTLRVDELKHDEVGRTAEAFNQMVGSFQKTVQAVLEGANQISSAAESLSTMSEKMDQRARSQTNAVSLMLSAIVKLGSSISAISDNAEEAHRVALLTEKSAISGSHIVAETLTEMNKISEAVHQSEKVVAQLGEDSGRISTILNTIKEIAEQTNLLALNAAIEAARAGEHGRGFAVVADDVRRLAERTAMSTDEIGNMIYSIQDGVRNVVSSMELATQCAAQGVVMTSSSGKSIQEIRNLAQESGAAIGLISETLLGQRATNELVSENTFSNVDDE